MEKRTVNHSTYVVERAYPATPKRVFAAFSDPAKKRRWYADKENGEVLEYEMDFRAGGKESSRFRSKGGPMAGAVFGNQTTYHDIVQNSRIVLAYTMSVNDKCISASLATFEFVATESGTNLVFTEQAAFFEGADGPQMREMGWRHLLESLAKELERS